MTGLAVLESDVRFGSPAVRGIPTAAIAEQVSAGDSVEIVASDFSLSLELVIAALSYEGLGRHRAA